MPIAASTWCWLRLGLASVYLMLALFLSPLLLQHELAPPSDSHHSESDLCAWLDHVAGTSLQSVHPEPSVAPGVAPVELPYQAPLCSILLFSDPSRGPPVLI